MESLGWAPEGIDGTVPNASRIYRLPAGRGSQFCGRSGVRETIEAGSVGSEAGCVCQPCVSGSVGSVAHVRAILAGNPGGNAAPPTVVLAGAAFHFGRDDPYAVVAQLRDAVVSGRYLAISHSAQVTELAKGQEAARQLLARTTLGYYRSREQIARLLTSRIPSFRWLLEGSCRWAGAGCDHDRDGSPGLGHL